MWRNAIKVVSGVNVNALHNTLPKVNNQQMLSMAPVFTNRLTAVSSMPRFAAVRPPMMVNTIMPLNSNTTIPTPFVVVPPVVDNSNIFREPITIPAPSSSPSSYEMESVKRKRKKKIKKHKHRKRLKDTRALRKKLGKK